MSDTLTISGSVQIKPDQSASEAALSGDFELNIPLNVTLTLSRKQTATVVIAAAEVPVSQRVNTDDIEELNFLLVRTNEPITLAISGELVTVDSFYCCVTETETFDQIDITTTGAATTVHLVMGRV